MQIDSTARNLKSSSRVYVGGRVATLPLTFKGCRLVRFDPIADSIFGKYLRFVLSHKNTSYIDAPATFCSYGRSGQSFAKADMARQSANRSTGKKRVTFYVPVERRRELKVLAIMLNTTIDALVRRGVDLVLKERKTKLPKRFAAYGK